MEKSSILLIAIGVVGFVLTKLTPYLKGSIVHVNLPSYMSYASIALIIFGLWFAFKKH